MYPDSRNYIPDPAYCSRILVALIGEYQFGAKAVAQRIGCEDSRVVALRDGLTQASYLEQFAIECLFKSGSSKAMFWTLPPSRSVWASLMIHVRQPFQNVWHLTCSKRNLKHHPRTELGYAPKELRAHIEGLFVEGMNWDNHGEWEIGHIRPVSDFELWDVDVVMRVHALANLRPVWRSINQSKGAKVEDSSPNTHANKHGMRTIFSAPNV